jgi:hypothetical protein
MNRVRLAPTVVRRVYTYLNGAGHNREHMSGKDWPGACKELLLKCESVHSRAFTFNLLSNSPRMNAPEFV